jgi:hypothetical protein
MSKLSPSCEAAFEEGYGAYEEGIQESDNPYDEATDEHLSWNDGFQEAEAYIDEWDEGEEDE